MIFLVWHILWPLLLFIVHGLSSFVWRHVYPLHLLYIFTWVTFVIIGILKSLCGDFQSNFYQHTPQLTVC